MSCVCVRVERVGMVKVRPAVVRVPVKADSEKKEMRDSRRKKERDLSILAPAILLSWQVCTVQILVCCYTYKKYSGQYRAMSSSLHRWPQ